MMCVLRHVSDKWKDLDGVESIHTQGETLPISGLYLTNDETNYRTVFCVVMLKKRESEMWKREIFVEPYFVRFFLIATGRKLDKCLLNGALPSFLSKSKVYLTSFVKNE